MFETRRPEHPAGEERVPRPTPQFVSDGFELESNSTLKSRNRTEVDETLAANGLVTLDVRDAPDRPGREYMFVTRRPDRAS